MIITNDNVKRMPMCVFCGENSSVWIGVATSDGSCYEVAVCCVHTEVDMEWTQAVDKAIKEHERLKIISGQE